jgi:hypothetical protein
MKKNPRSEMANDIKPKTYAGEGESLLLYSPDGSCWKITVDDQGNIVTKKI